MTVCVLLGAALVLAACATPQERTAGRENLLSSAGFTERPADTPARVALLRKLPANKLVKRTKGASVRYVYADPAACGCVYVGTQAALDRYRTEVTRRQLADERVFDAAEDQNEVEDWPWEPL
jgi:hypothetical protein